MEYQQYLMKYRKYWWQTYRPLLINWMILITKRVWVYSVHVCWFTQLLYIQWFEGDKLEEWVSLKYTMCLSIHKLSFKMLVTLSHQHSRKRHSDSYFVGRSKLTRTNTVAANAFVNEISGYRLGEPDHCSLGGTVDTPVHNTCVEETHMSLTQTHTRKAIIWDKRITMNMVILQRLNVPWNLSYGHLQWQDSWKIIYLLCLMQQMPCLLCFLTSLPTSRMTQSIRLVAFKQNIKGENEE